MENGSCEHSDLYFRLFYEKTVQNKTKYSPFIKVESLSFRFFSNNNFDLKIVHIFIIQSGILNNLSEQSGLPPLDNFSYVFDTNDREH